MSISDSQLAEIIGALIALLIAYLIAYTAQARYVVAAFILAAPFEFVDTRFGSVQMLYVYVMALAFLMRGAITRVPLWGSVVLVLLSYLLSLSQVSPATLTSHLLYIFALLSAFFVYFMVYNSVRNGGHVQFTLNIFHALNVLVLVYCPIQMAAGYDNVLFTIGALEIAIDSPRMGGDYRLTGPFGSAPGLFAEYLVITIYLCLADYIYSLSRAKRLLLTCLILFNVGALIATANRGGIILLGVGFPVFLWLLRNKLGVMRAISMFSFAVVLAGLASIFIIEYTDFNQAFDRLAATEVEGGVPDSRQNVWRMAFSEIPKRPLLGHGPNLVPGVHGGGLSAYPHNLYIYLLYTIGAVGLFLFCGFLALVFHRMVQVRNSDEYNGIPRVSWLLMGIFLIDQLKIEFLRFVALDYWYYCFALLAFLMAVADLARSNMQQRQSDFI